MNALFLSQLKNIPWAYADLVVDVDGEALTIATLIERYKVLKNASANIKSMIKKETSKTKTKTEKSSVRQSSIE